MSTPFSLGCIKLPLGETVFNSLQGSTDVPAFIWSTGFRRLEQNNVQGLIKIIS